MATSSANNHHTLDPFLLYLSSSVIFPGLPLAPHTQGTPNKKSILSTRQCHHNYSSQTAIEDKLHLHCLFTRSLWLSSGPSHHLLLPLILHSASCLRPSICPLTEVWMEIQRAGVTTGDGTAKEQKSQQLRLPQQSHFMKYSFSLSPIRQFQALQAAATKCATVILPEHSLIKAEIFPYIDM